MSTAMMSRWDKVDCTEEALRKIYKSFLVYPAKYIFFLKKKMHIKVFLEYEYGHESVGQS